jgi:hypothetical protein
VGGAAGPGDDQAQAAPLGCTGVGKKTPGGAMGADYAHFDRDALAPKEGLSGAEVGPIRAATHNDADQRAGWFQAVKMEGFFAREKSLGAPDSG